MQWSGFSTRLSISVAFFLWFSDSSSVSLFCFLHPFFPDDSRPSMKSISHLGAGWHWQAACAIWRLMAKPYYANTPRWKFTACSQYLYPSLVFMNFEIGVCFLIWFGSFLAVQKLAWVCRLLTLTIAFISTTKPWKKCSSFFFFFFATSPPFLLLFHPVCFLLKRADCAPLSSSWPFSLKQSDTLSYFHPHSLSM